MLRALRNLGALPAGDEASEGLAGAGLAYKLVYQSRLSDPRLSRNEDDLPLSPQGAAEADVRRGELAFVFLPVSAALAPTTTSTSRTAAINRYPRRGRVSVQQASCRVA